VHSSARWRLRRSGARKCQKKTQAYRFAEVPRLGSLARDDRKRERSQKFGGAAPSTPPLLPFPHPQPPHHIMKRLLPACLLCGPRRKPASSNRESLNQAPPRAFSFILSRHIPNGSPSPPRVPPGPQTTPSTASSPASCHRTSLSASGCEALPMRLKPRPPYLLRHCDAHPLRNAGLEHQRIRTLHQPPLRVSGLFYLASKHEHRRAHPALNIDSMHIANLGEHPLTFIEWMSELTQGDEIIGPRKFTHTI
jgi:hypothetical protein